ncbi:MAG: D-alanyl-D-alanine carboxypeptidase family protein [Actinomycetota bacterium]|nr:D-alanyl-D-alanine carboxypeptidase family protein [Actinomycetota bacterium]
MSLVVSCAALALALLFGGYGARLSAAASLQARAQLAADAAALAAVAESGPYGRASHEAVARRFASSNGARLLGCWCEPGATSVQVRVALGEATAEARAVLDPAALAPAPGPVGGTGLDWLPAGGTGLHPLMEDALERLLAAADGAVWVNSGYRSPERQAELWQAALEKYGDPEVADDWVARPGDSMHGRGLAADLGGDVAMAVRLIDRLQLPLHRPLSNEPWHFELTAGRR